MEECAEDDMLRGGPLEMLLTDGNDNNTTETRFVDDEAQQTEDKKTVDEDGSRPPSPACSSSSSSSCNSACSSENEAEQDEKKPAEENPDDVDAQKTTDEKKEDVEVEEGEREEKEVKEESTTTGETEENQRKRHRSTSAEDRRRHRTPPYKRYRTEAEVHGRSASKPVDTKKHTFIETCSTMSERCRRFKSSIFTGEPTKNVQEASFLAMALQVAAAAIVGDDFADVAETSVQPEWGSSSGMAALGKWTSDIGASVQCINSPYPKITRETKLGHTIRIILKKDNRNA